MPWTLGLFPTPGLGTTPLGSGIISGGCSSRDRSRAVLVHLAAQRQGRAGVLPGLQQRGRGSCPIRWGCGGTGLRGARGCGGHGAAGGTGPQGAQGCGTASPALPAASRGGFVRPGQSQAAKAKRVPGTLLGPVAWELSHCRWNLLLTLPPIFCTQDPAL